MFGPKNLSTEQTGGRHLHRSWKRKLFPACGSCARRSSTAAARGGKVYAIGEEVDGGKISGEDGSQSRGARCPSRIARCFTASRPDHSSGGRSSSPLCGNKIRAQPIGKHIGVFGPVVSDVESAEINFTPVVGAQKSETRDDPPLPTRTPYPASLPRERGPLPASTSLDGDERHRPRLTSVSPHDEDLLQHAPLHRSDLCRRIFLHGRDSWEADPYGDFVFEDEDGPTTPGPSTPTTSARGALLVRRLKSDTPQQLARQISGVWENYNPLGQGVTAQDLPRKKGNCSSRISSLFRKISRKVFHALMTSSRAKFRNVIAADFSGRSVESCSFRIAFSASVRVWGRKELEWCEQVQWYRGQGKSSVSVLDDPRSHDQQDRDPSGGVVFPPGSVSDSARTGEINGNISGQGGIIPAPARGPTSGDNYEETTRTIIPPAHQQRTTSAAGSGIPPQHTNSAGTTYQHLPPTTQEDEDRSFSTLLDLLFGPGGPPNPNPREENALISQEEILDKELQKFGWTLSSERVPHPFLQPGKLYWRFSTPPRNTEDLHAFRYVIVHEGTRIGPGVFIVLNLQPVALFEQRGATTSKSPLPYNSSEAVASTSSSPQEELLSTGEQGGPQEELSVPREGSRVGAGGEAGGERGEQEEPGGALCRFLGLQMRLFATAYGVEVSRHFLIFERQEHASEVDVDVE